MTTGHQTERLSHRPQGFNGTPTVDVFQQMKPIASDRIAATIRADKGTMTVLVIEAKAIRAATAGTRAVMIAEYFGWNTETR
jgi:hypothetical protein